MAPQQLEATAFSHQSKDSFKSNPPKKSAILGKHIQLHSMSAWSPENAKRAYLQALKMFTMANHEEESSLSSFFTYDVFLSFRGEDTRHNFIAHLRKELSRKGINTFFDDEKLRIGEDISPALSKAIEDSKICIIVFSVNYATSTWCLTELVKILECVNKSNSKQVAVPIFYHVDPSDVRKQKNSYEEAMIKHENRFGKDSENVQKWRSALSVAANFKGEHIISTGRIDETTSIEKIVKDVYALIDPKPLHSGEDPVGLEDRIEGVKSLLNMKPNDDTVSMLGIYGLGGIGKTELAKAVYDKIVHQFDAASFLADVREKSNKINGIEDLQKTLLSEMKEELDRELGSSDKGIHEIKCRLRRKKVLLILDDVDDIKSLEKLVGACDWFGPGSRIIITTRDKKLLDIHKVVKIYEMTVLNDQYSLKLFCKKAFKQNHPKPRFKALSSRAVRYAKGLPLALKVIGSDLSTVRSFDDWENALEAYEMVLDSRIEDVLKITYERLGDNAKQVFLEIACFYKGKNIQYVEDILKEFCASYNIKVLVDKSLLSVEYGCYLKMHDLIQDMGRAIGNKESTDLRKRKRIWSPEDVVEVLTEDSGSDAIEGIMLDPSQREKINWSGEALKKTKRLRTLIVRNTSFSSEPNYLPNSLRVLDWEEYPSMSFPPADFYPKKISAIYLCKSNLITLNLPFKQQAFLHLTDMNFSFSKFITEIPDVSGAQNLRKLTLNYCRNLITVDRSIGFLKNLCELSASGCTALKNFPREIFLPSLKLLDLSGCVTLEHFPDVKEKMEKRLSLYMRRTSIKELPNSICNLTGLRSMDISENRELKCVPSNLFTFPNVECLTFEGCYQLGGSWEKILETPSAAHGSSTIDYLERGNAGFSDGDLLTILNFVPKLEELIARNNEFVSLPACIKDSVYLRELDLSGCKNLKRIPKCPNSLKMLNVEDCWNLEDISELPSTVEVVRARGCSNLSKETSDMFWSHYQVSKEICGLYIVMPIITEIPSEWFDFIGNGGNPRFWARSGSKFPIFALALVFSNSEYDKYYGDNVDCNLVINGRCVPTNFHESPTIPLKPDHVLICNLLYLLGVEDEEELLSLDAFLEHDWNQVEVVPESTLVTVRSWGIYMYRSEGTNMEDVQFTCPDPKYSYMETDSDEEINDNEERVIVDTTPQEQVAEVPPVDNPPSASDDASIRKHAW